MRITIHQRDLEMSPSLETYIDTKVIKQVERLLKNVQLADLPILDITVERTTEHHRKGQVYRASATLALGAKVLRAEAEDEDIHAACDALEDELKREITTFKTKSLTLIKRGGRVAKRALHLSKDAQPPPKKREWHEGN